MIPSIRLLPVLVVAAFVVLGLRITDVVTGASLERDPFEFDAVVTLTQARAAEEEAAGEAASDQVATGEAAMPAAHGDGAMQAAAEGEEKSEDLWFDPDGRDLTRSELRLLQELSERRKQLSGREQGLDQREALLDAAEARFEQKLSELETLRDQISVLVKQHSKEQDAQLASLVKIYESMKPKDAARILDSLDMDVLLNVMVRMKEAKSAAIMAEMDAARAREVTLQLADRGRLPDGIQLQ
jgi:flagellar motility protein MotE (MotC chaperone)